MPGLRDLIDGWSNGRAVRGAAVISEDGLMVHQSLAAVADGEAVAALAVSLLRSGVSWGKPGDPARSAQWSWISPAARPSSLRWTTGIR